MIYTCYSGGAAGADTIFKETGLAFGIRTIEYRPEDYNQAPIELRNEVDIAVKNACEALKRPFQPDKPYYGLIARDYFQALNSDAIFAISRLVNPNHTDSRGFINKSNKTVVSGGTGYACEMAIQMKKPVFVFDMNSEHGWYYWEYDTHQFHPVIIKSITYPHIPKLTHNFAGIGSRDVTEAGIKAIEDLFLRTFGIKK